MELKVGHILVTIGVSHIVVTLGDVSRIQRESRLSSRDADTLPCRITSNRAQVSCIVVCLIRILIVREYKVSDSYVALEPN